MKKYKNFSEFWPFYLSQHLNPINRALHATGTVLALTTLLYLILNGQYAVAPLSLFLGYILAWIGHFYFEGNRPATLGYARLSFLGDFKMVSLILSGKLNQELKRLDLA